MKIYLFLLFSCLLFVALALPACAPKAPPPATTPPATTPPSAPSPSAELSFQAETYTNSELGFSVKYPMDWKQSTAVKSPTLVFLAQASSQVPILSVDIAEGTTFADATTTALQEAGSTDINFKSQNETTLADGTKAFECVVQYKNPMAPMAIDAFYLGAQKDNKWVIVSVATVGLIAKFDQAKFSEIAHTLQFK
jgi:hypothetical protein